MLMQCPPELHEGCSMELDMEVCVGLGYRIVFTTGAVLLFLRFSSCALFCC